MYYNKTIKDIIYTADLARMGLPVNAAVLREVGIYPVVVQADIIENASVKVPIKHEPVYDEDLDCYVQRTTYEDLSVLNLRANLPQFKQRVRENFLIAFGEIDYRSTRATQDVTARNVEIAAIEENLTKVTGQAAEELSLLRAELLKSNVSDGRVLVEMRQIAEANRDMQTELLALEIAEDMTLEEAQEIILRIANARPWLPWRE